MKIFDLNSQKDRDEYAKSSEEKMNVLKFVGTKKFNLIPILVTWLSNLI